jgi:hypothetical protein
VAGRGLMQMEAAIEEGVSHPEARRRTPRPPERGGRA